MNPVGGGALWGRYAYLPRMRVAVFRTPDVSAEGFSQLMGLLQSLPGPIQFDAPGEGDSGTEVNPWEAASLRFGVPWELAFSKMSDLRASYELENEDALFLLTETPNESNFFAFAEPVSPGPGNHCVHTGAWGLIAGLDFIHPTLHIVASNLLQGWMYKTMDEWHASAHHSAVGCVSDFCADKRDILKRLRTADVCSGCLDRFNEAISAGKLKVGQFHQCMELLELARKELLFHNRISRVTVPSPIEVRGPQMKIWLPDFQRHIELGGTPKNLYLFYLRHPEGVRYEDLDAHREELMEIYDAIRGDKTREQLREHFDRLLDLSEMSTMNQQVSRIRSAVRSAVGPDLLSIYMWENSRDAEKRIPIAGMPGMVGWMLEV